MATPIAAKDLTNTDVEATVDVTTFTAPDLAGNSTSNYGGRLRLMIKNSVGTADTLSVDRVVVVDGEALDAHEFTIPASKTVVIGPFPVTIFGGTLTYTLGAVTSTVIPIVTD